MSEKYAEDHGLIIDRSLNLFDKGLSGYTGENRKKGALAVFIKAVEKKIVPRGSFLLVESLDRLSRDTLSEQMTLFMQLVNSGITVVTLKDNQVYSKATIDADISRLMLSLVIMMRAHDESSMKAHRLLEAWKAKRQNVGEKKLTAQCPRWLKLSTDKTTFVPIPERVAMLRRIYEMSLGGMGLKTITRILNEEKVPQWTPKGKGWQISYVGRLLSSRAVIGEHQSQQLQNRKPVPVGDPIPNYYPTVIDLPTWQKAQARRKTATPGRAGKQLSNLFSGFAFDGYTGMPMRHARYGASSHGANNSYLVSDYGRMQRNAKAVRWRYSWFEKWFLDYIVRLDWKDVANEETPDDEILLQKRLAEQQAKVEGIDKSLERLANLARTTDTPPKTLLDQMIKLESEREGAARKLGQLEAETESASVKGQGLAFVMTIFQKIAASSFAAVQRTLRRRLIALTIQESLMHDQKLDIDQRNGALDEARALIRELHGIGTGRLEDAQVDQLLADYRYKILKLQREEEEALGAGADEFGSETGAADAEDAAISSVAVALPEERRRIKELLATYPAQRETKVEKLIGALGVLWRQNPQERMVIFATYLGSVEMLGAEIDRQYPGQGVTVLKGGDHGAKTAAEKRFKAPDGPRVLICTAAGREGINLQHARVLFNFDLPWNPMDLEQRIGRIHRYVSES